MTGVHKTTGYAGGSQGRVVSQNKIEAYLRDRFPALTRSQASKISRRHATIEMAENEARRRINLDPQDLPRTAYVGRRPTEVTALAIVKGSPA